MTRTKPVLFTIYRDDGDGKKKKIGVATKKEAFAVVDTLNQNIASATFYAEEKKK